jgi:DNA-binding transcriptional LysR family regulator
VLGWDFYRHAVVMLCEAGLAETAIRHRLSEPTGTVRCTAAVATMQFAMRDIVADFLVRYPKINVVAHATDQNVDIVGENYDVAIRAHCRTGSRFDLCQPGGCAALPRLGRPRRPRRPMRVCPPAPHVAGVYAVTTDAFVRRAV